MFEMPVQDILSSLSHTSYLNNPSILTKRQNQAALTREQLKFLRKRLKKALDAGDPLKAANYLYAALILDESHCLPMIQKDGLLRISRYSYQKHPLEPAIAHLMKPGLGLSASSVDYLQTLSHLYSIAISVHKEYDLLKKWLSSEREVGIKSALAALDFLFLRHADGFWMGEREQTSRHPLFFTIEELAEGFSSILALYNDKFGQLRGNPAIKADKSSIEYSIDMLISAAHIAAFREWEFKVDRMGYRLLRTVGTNEFILSHPSKEFLRAVELGFIRSFSQRVIKPMGWAEENDRPLKELAKLASHKLTEQGYIRLEAKPFERYSFKFPEEILRTVSHCGEFFREERPFLLLTCQDLLTTLDQLMNFDIGNGLTFEDCFLVSRMMRFISLVFADILSPEIDSRPEIVFQSIIPVFTRDILVSLLGQAVGNEKAENVISMLTANINEHVDIQYKPLLPAGKTIFFPTNIFVASNIYRNILMIRRKRLYESGKVDPLGDSLHRTFENRGALSKSRVTYSWDGRQGEIDVLVLIDNLLFAFECKNSLLPTGPHELMTSLDYLYTAADQLDRFKHCFTDFKFRQCLAKDRGLFIDSETQLVTGIILSNRMFPGLRVGGHPVRGNYELDHFVEEGTIAQGDESRCFWLGEAFTGNDLRRFLEEDITYQPIWTATKQYVAKYLLSDCAVHDERFKLDSIALADQ